MSNIACEFIGRGCFKASVSRVSPEESERDTMGYYTCAEHKLDACELIEAEGLTPVIAALNREGHMFKSKHTQLAEMAPPGFFERTRAERVRHATKGQPMDKYNLARQAYDAYGAVTGEPMPAFDDLPETIKEAWCAAAARVASVCLP